MSQEEIPSVELVERLSTRTMRIHKLEFDSVVSQEAEIRKRESLGWTLRSAQDCQPGTIGAIFVQPWKK